MARTTADLVDEVIILLERGQLHLEDGPRLYGSRWAEIAPAVSMALRVQEASHPPIVSQRPFVPFDKAAGWNSLQAQLAVASDVSAPLRRPVAQQRRNWREWLSGWLGSGLGRASAVGLAGLVIAFTFGLLVSTSQPGDWFYRAKLGWDYLSEVTSLSADDKAQAALNYAQHRLNELEKLAFVGRPEQVAEVEAQYARGLEASLQYTGYKNFSAYGQVYSRLNDQRERVFNLLQSEYALGPRSQLNSLLARLDYGVFILKPRATGETPVTVVTPGPAATAPPEITAAPTPHP